MTVFLPLDAGTPPPHSPSFLLPPVDAQSQLHNAMKAIRKAKRIVVICGAGISVQAGIPDFRSPEGLFKSLKRDNPREFLASGKDLFDASVFNSENKTSMFCQMIAQLSELSEAAQPTAFHHLLRALDDRGKLLRVYTQNIDALEQKCGLTFGVPEYEAKRCRTRSKGKSLKLPEEISSIPEDLSQPERLPSPPVETPRCIPLHGTLQLVHCQICNHSYPLPEYLPSLASGQPPQCPECTSIEETRQLVGKRPRGIGKLRPSVVLYNEAHKDGEGVGEVVRKDLIGSSKGKGRSGADLLLVVGTSLRVPGTKRMVREFAKAVRARRAGSSSKDEHGTPSSPRRSPTQEEEPAMKALYLNLDFPVPTREWEGVFDAWIQGDAQQLAEMLQDEIDKESRAKELVLEKKRRKDEEAALLPIAYDTDPDVVQQQEPCASKTPSKRKSMGPMRTPIKRKKVESALPSPPPTQIEHRPDSTQQRKLMLRIPAVARRASTRAEVCYTPCAPPIVNTTTAAWNELHIPTPSPTPFNKRTKAGRRAARLAQQSKLPSERGRKKAISVSVASDEDDVLPEFVIHHPIVV